MEDSDAAVSVIPLEQRKLGQLLSNAEGGPSPLFRGLQLIVVVLAVAFFARFAEITAAVYGSEPNELLRLSAVLGSFAVGMCLLPLGSARVALRPGGALESLGAGEQKIGAADARSLALWRLILGGFSALIALVGVQWILVLGVSGRRFRGDPIANDERVGFVLLGLVTTFVLPVFFLGWQASMFTASCLCRDSVTEVVRKVRAADPPAGDSAADTDEDRWQTTVAAPALALHESLDKLSEGWGPGLLGVCGCACFGAMMSFTLSINPECTRSSSLCVFQPQAAAAQTALARRCTRASRKDS